MKIFGVAFIASLVLFFGAHTASAATLYLSPTTAELNRGDSIKLSLRLDVDRDECVNAIDGVLSYSENIEPVDISRGASIMSIWVEDPVINRADRTITFAGGIPNGYCGRIVGDPRLTNNIVDLVFQSPGFVIGNKQGTSSDMARVDVADATQIYLNDGFGTRTVVNRYGADIALSARAGNAINNQWREVVSNDVQPPEEFSVTLNKTMNAFSGRYFVTFNTTDKQSGLDHYEVIEEASADFWNFKWGREDAPWTEVRSPYVLKDQSLNSTIRVRAIDKSGNEYVASLVPEASQRTLTRNALILIGLAVAVVVGLLLALVVYIVLRRRHALDARDEEEGGDDEEVLDEPDDEDGLEAGDEDEDYEVVAPKKT